MEKILVFFSSDLKVPYQKDIFRSTALPDDYVLHFRYKPVYVHQDILENINQLQNKEGYIFFARSTKGGVSVDFTLNLISIRRIEVLEAIYNRSTDVVHFYLKLKNFVDIQLDKNNSTDDLPPHNFVGLYYSKETAATTTWINRVNNISSSFPNTIFFNVKSLRLGKKIIVPNYSFIEKESHYQITDENQYHLEMSFSDNTEGEAKFNIYNTEKVVANIPKDLQVGMTADDKNISIITHSIDIQTHDTFLNFTSEFEDKIIYDVVLRLHIKRKQKPFLLFVWTFIAYVGILLGQFVSSQDLTSENTVLTTASVIKILIISGLLFSSSTAFLYKLFNKK